MNAAKKTGIFIADERKLPHSKQRIKEAILYALRLTKDAAMREELKSAYLSLAGWQAGVGEAGVISPFSMWLMVFFQRDALKKLTSASDAERKVLQSELQRSSL